MSPGRSHLRGTTGFWYICLGRLLLLVHCCSGSEPMLLRPPLLLLMLLLSLRPQPPREFRYRCTYINNCGNKEEK